MQIWKDSYNFPSPSQVSAEILIGIQSSSVQDETQKYPQTAESELSSFLCYFFCKEKNPLSQLGNLCKKWHTSAGTHQRIMISHFSVHGAKFRTICIIVLTSGPWDGRVWRLRGLQHSSKNKGLTKDSIS